MNKWTIAADAVTLILMIISIALASTAGILICMIFRRQNYLKKHQEANKVISVAEMLNGEPLMPQSLLRERNY